MNVFKRDGILKTCRVRKSLTFSLFSLPHFFSHCLFYNSLSITFYPKKNSLSHFFPKKTYFLTFFVSKTQTIVKNHIKNYYKFKSLFVSSLRFLIFVILINMLFLYYYYYYYYLLIPVIQIYNIYIQCKYKLNIMYHAGIVKSIRVHVLVLI